jgi:hypothetical protein
MRLRLVSIFTFSTTFNPTFTGRANHRKTSDGLFDEQENQMSSVSRTPCRFLIGIACICSCVDARAENIVLVETPVTLSHFE